MELYLRLDTAQFQRKTLLANLLIFGVPCFFVRGVSIFCCILSGLTLVLDSLLEDVPGFFKMDCFVRLTVIFVAAPYPHPTAPLVFEAAASLCSGAVAEVMVFCLESASSANALATHLAARCVAAGGPVGTLETRLKVC